MKRLTILTILILFASKSFACKCTNQSIENKFIQSDFVAKIKMLKKYPNKENSSFYKADIQVLDLYKGDTIESIFIYGNYKDSQESACWIYTDKNEILIVYGLKAIKNYQLDICASILRLNKKSNSDATNERYQKEQKILEILKLNKVNFINKIKFSIDDFHKFSRKSYGIKLEKNFAIYELTFKENLSVKCIKVIEGFNNKIERKIKKFLKKTNWSSTIDLVNNSKVPKNSKTLVIIYYKEEKDNKGYVTERF